jgi:signal transduction histidine kinase
MAHAWQTFDQLLLTALRTPGTSTMGQLSASIAHQLNQPLAAILEEIKIVFSAFWTTKVSGTGVGLAIRRSDRRGAPWNAECQQQRRRRGDLLRPMAAPAVVLIGQR